MARVEADLQQRNELPISSAVIQAFHNWNEHNAPQLAAAISYAALFSVAPLVIIGTAVAGLVYGRQAARGLIYAQLRAYVAPPVASAIQTLVVGASRPTSGIVGAVVGVVLLLIGAASIFGLLRLTLNQIWEVKPRPGPIWRAVAGHLPSFAMVVVIGALLFVSLATTTVLAAVASFFSKSVPIASRLQAADFFVSVAVVTVLFAAIYKILPDVEIKWNDVWGGAVIASIFFNLGQLIIGFYLTTATVGSSYGAAGSLVVILVWVYFSAQVFLFGAELMRVYAAHGGLHITDLTKVVSFAAYRATRRVRREQTKKGS